MIMHHMCVVPWPFRKMNRMIMEVTVNCLLDASPWATLLR